MIQWSSELLDTHIAPGFSALETADIPAIPGEFPEAPHWLANHFMNAVFRGSFPPSMRQAAVGFLRRTQDAMRSYDSAREATNSFLEIRKTKPPALRAYYGAVTQWEHCVLHIGMAIDVLRYFGGGTPVFQKNDGSSPQLIYTMANQVKHVGSCIASGQCTATDTVPLWLSSKGVCSFGVEVAYADIALTLQDMARLADMIQDPITFADKLKATLSGN